MTEVQLVVAAGLFSLAGVVLGAFLAPLTQLYLEKKREHRAYDRAKLLVAAELLHAQLTLRSVSLLEYWPLVENVDAFLPTSAWRENRSSLVGNVHEDLGNQLVMTYALIEMDRARLLMMCRSPEPTPLPTTEAEGLKRASYNLGRLRRQLGGGGAWLDEIHEAFKPQVASLNEEFKRWLNGLSEDELKSDAVIMRVRRRANDLGDLNRDLGDNGAWALEINEEIRRRLEH